MRYALLALPFALLPLHAAQAANHEHSHAHAHEEHASLDAHEHGVASLNVALDGQTLEIQLQSPAMNLVGFEHEAKSDADKAKVAAARQHLEQPQALFALPIEAKCALQDSELDSPLFGGHAHDEHEHADEHGHSDIDASYRFACANAEALQTLELGSFFGTFPGTEKLEVQLIGPSGQQGAELTPSNSRLSF
ncbi:MULTISPECIES: DUF2796 domain-containing protein [Pseudomonadaceae]|jgi:hypothetical protein|uniref:DUF2796 domain-containing protein n=2 Tax=Aquipseudomonas alcaligenes TaxID=43263 RepID=A0AA42ST79_AQUAC|nr:MULTISPECIES: DUF2796 domain-containing protein [Pseudomonas]MDH1055738.1 DUF2796 domain-containing protein [Pseudomonas alcaligenes]NMY43580.1 DUF2796 domain-containing protein [Pseudomonas sp. WS 5013]SUD19345.1 putative zinc-binding protein [Pseudomonas alcaligenes]BCR23191.1 hypothetical protein KAM426_07180 [Pseudomonas alcaligenes]GAD62906.1 hypothetical protein PA6_017_00220 [Pseudomonas alcaligenes NBRC 14159]